MALPAARSSFPRSRQRGVTLLESLVAFFVLALGSVAVAQLQGHLRLGADVARERSEAVRFAEDAVEEMRSFATVDGPPGMSTYAAIATGSTVADSASAATRTTYRVERLVDDAAFAGTKAASVTVHWSDRSGASRRVDVHTFIAAVDPAYSGSLALDVGAIPAAPRGVHGRKPGLPLGAKSLGDGRSVWKPLANGSTAWVFDDVTGAIVGTCDGIAPTTATRDLVADALRSCATGRWLLVSGTVRSAATAPPAAVGLAPGSAAVAIDLRDGVYPAPAACFGEARKTVRFVVDGGVRVEDVALDASAAAPGMPLWEETGDRFLAWHCIVAPRSDARWSGRIAIVAVRWSIGTGGGDGRVCRYAAGDDRAAIDANIASAGIDVDVGAALLGRNFLIVRGSDPCPRTPPAEQHQP